ncbi:MAG: FAD-dependent oxidoreductase [Chloroflexi bacterium]|nr:FAD-dependent oxidoreductase [Chloroflexota bacterium]
MQHEAWERHEDDVVVVGAGGAGATAALTAQRAGARVAVISKDPFGVGNTRISGGGIATEDNPQDMLDDLARSGEGIEAEDLVRVMADEASAGIRCLEEQGYVFLVDAEGKPRREPRGGHSKARVLAGPKAGVSMGQTLRWAAARDDLTIHEEMVALRLLGSREGVAGLLALDLASGRYHVFRCGSVVLATGGAGWLYYPHTTNVKAATGDGYALALRMGAELRDMEMVQFLPFGLTHPSCTIGCNAGEPSAVAGPRGVLRDASGQMVLDRLNLRTRAEVSNVVWATLRSGAATPFGGILLDVTGNLETSGDEREVWRRRTEEAIRFAYGVRAQQGFEPWDVAPTIHYFMGGVVADVDGRCRVPGLFAVGEACGGLHGANRLSSLALAELWVFGQRAGAAAAQTRTAPPLDPTQVEAAVDELEQATQRREGPRPIQVRTRLAEAMWRYAAGHRDEAGLRRAIEVVKELAAEASQCRVGGGRAYNTALVDYVELRSLLLVAEAVARSALERRESRGAHVRIDFPERGGSEWEWPVVVWLEDGELRCEIRRGAA